MYRLFETADVHPLTAVLNYSFLEHILRISTNPDDEAAALSQLPSNVKAVMELMIEVKESDCS
jgi:hypothetical protein